MNEKSNLARHQESSPERVQQQITVAPLVDVYENQDELLLVADVPGATNDGINVHLDRASSPSKRDGPANRPGPRWRPSIVLVIISGCSRSRMASMHRRSTPSSVRITIPMASSPGGRDGIIEIVRRSRNDCLGGELRGTRMKSFDLQVCRAARLK